MADFLDTKLTEIRERLTELRPLVEEFKRLEAAEGALNGVEQGSRAAGANNSGDRESASAGGRRKSLRRGSPQGSAARARRGRPKGTGNRATQALELVRQRPGISISDLAEAMDIQQNYLYRVMPDLAEQGEVYKEGRGWHPRQEDAHDAAAEVEPAPATAASDEAETTETDATEKDFAAEVASDDDTVESDSESPNS